MMTDTMANALLNFGRVTCSHVAQAMVNNFDEPLDNKLEKSLVNILAKLLLNIMTESLRKMAA